MSKARDIADSTETLDVDGGTIKLDGNYPVGTNNVALGNDAMLRIESGADSNTVVGHSALSYLTTGDQNTAVGRGSLNSVTTGSYNSAFGFGALNQTTGQYNTAVGVGSLQLNTTASNNTAVGYQAAYSTTTGAYNTAFGTQTLLDNTTGYANAAFAADAMGNNTTGFDNTALGNAAMFQNTTGSYNVALGRAALQNNTTASNNTVVGYQAGYNSTTASQNTIIGRAAGKLLTTGGVNTIVGDDAGVYATTGTRNTFVGQSSGYNMTTGSKNTILGRYTGNQNGLDIRTSSNNIVLSDGDGNPRIHVDDTGEVKVGHNSSLPNLANGQGGDGFTIGAANALNTFRAICSASDAAACIYLSKSASPSDNRHISFYRNGSQVGNVTTSASATSYNTTSDYRLKENVVELTGATDRLKQLNPSRFNFIADADTTVDGFIAHEVQSVVPEAITGTKDAVDDDGNPVYQGIDQSKLVPLLVATIQELEARITALEAN